jgi:phosphate transport system permease protein
VQPGLGSLSAYALRRKLVNFAMCGALGLLACLAILPLLGVFLHVLREGAGGLSWDFFTELPKPVGETGGGMANALVGTVLLVAMAGLLGVPWGIAAGVYLSEYGTGKLARFLRLSTDLMTSVPSIIVGIFAYAVVVLPMGRFSAHAGAFALAVIMIPIIARTTEELLRLVPDHVREAGLALGIPRWKVVLRIVVLGSRGGLATGVILAVARVSGETAPLLFTAFGNRFWAHGLDQPIASLPVQIYTYAISPYEEWHRQAWAGALVLVVFVLFLNLGTRLLLRRR